MEQTQSARSYRWAELPSDAPIALITRQRVIGRQAMISRVELKEGCVVPTHAHENEQFACILSGKLRFGIGAQGTDDYNEVVAAGGEVMHLPSNVPHSADALEDTVVLDVFSPPSEATGIDQTPEAAR